MVFGRNKILEEFVKLYFFPIDSIREFTIFRSNVIILDF